MIENRLAVSDKILLVMHNLCLIKPEIAKTGREIAKSIRMAVDNVIKILDRLEANGYIKSFKDSKGYRKFYLTSIGIIKVCSTFT